MPQPPTLARRSARRRPALAAALLLALVACAGVEAPAPDPTPTPETARVVPGGFVAFDAGAVVAAPDGALEGSVDAYATPAGPAEGTFPPGVTPVGASVRFGALADVRAGAAPLAIGLAVPAGVVPERTAIAVRIEPGDATGRYLGAPVWEVLASVLDAEGAFLLAPVGGLAGDGRLAVVVTGEGLDTPRLAARSLAAREVRSAQGAAFEVACVGFDGPFAALTNPWSIPCTAADRADLETALLGAYVDLTGVGFRAPALPRSVSILDSAASLADGVVDLLFGPYEAQLRPFRPVAEDADTWGCGRRPSGRRNLGGYASWSETLFVCIDADGLFDANGRPTDAVDTARHEYFHATQHAYPSFGSFTRGRDLWVVEGTAVASERSLATMERATDRDPRAVDVRLPADDDTTLPHYEAQDFFVFTGQALGRGLEYLRPVFARGARGYDVDAALRDDLGVPGGLGEMYWRWARHQAMNDSAVAAAPCGPVADVAAPRTLSFGPDDPDGAATGVLPSLTAHRHDLTFTADPATAYQVEVRVVPDRTGVMRVMTYEHDVGANPPVACARRLETDRLEVLVPAGTTDAQVQVLVVNTEPDPIQVHLGYRLEVRVRPTVVIVAPTDGAFRSAGERVDLRARITAPDPRVAALPVEWLVDYTVPGWPRRQWAFTSASGETLAFREHDPYCDGWLEVEALVDSLSVTSEYANLRDVATVTLDGLPPGRLQAVVVAPPRPVHHLEIDPATDLVPTYLLRGYASQRRCGADGLPGVDARWGDGGGGVFAQGPTPLALEVDDAFFADGQGSWRSRRLELRVDVGGRFAWTPVVLVPCAGRDGGAPLRPGVPTCPAEIDGFWYDLEAAFEALAALPSWQELVFALEGPTRDLEGALGLGAFPADPTTTLPRLDVASPVRAYLSDLVGLLDGAPTVDDALAALDDLDARVGPDEALVGVDADLYWMASGLARDALLAFDRADPFRDLDEVLAGHAPAGDGFARFAFVRPVDAALVEVDAVAPARAAVAGFLTTAAERRSGEPVHLRAATLGALLGASEALRDVGYGER